MKERQPHEIINAHGGDATKDKIIKQPIGVGKYFRFKINPEASSIGSWLSVEGNCGHIYQDESSEFGVSAGGVGAAAGELFNCAEIIHSEEGQLYHGERPLPQTEEELTDSIGLRRYHRSDVKLIVELGAIMPIIQAEAEKLSLTMPECEEFLGNVQKGLFDLASQKGG